MRKARDTNKKITHKHSLDIQKAADLYDIPIPEFPTADPLTYEDLNYIEGLIFANITDIRPPEAAGMYQHVGRTTVAWISLWDGKIKIITGISVKRKGDIHNNRVGEIIALLNLYSNFIDENHNTEPFYFRWT